MGPLESKVETKEKTKLFPLINCTRHWDALTTSELHNRWRRKHIGLFLNSREFYVVFLNTETTGKTVGRGKD